MALEKVTNQTKAPGRHRGQGFGNPYHVAKHSPDTKHLLEREQAFEEQRKKES
jgi:hypothetical protein